MRPVYSSLDRYLLGQVTATLVSVFAIVISLMLFEHLPRLFDIVRLSGRKGYIVVQSMIGLLPEYGGIGLLFGLYLAIALTVRRLSLRGELDVIEATGVPSYRWMRFPTVLALLVAFLLLLNQGWLMPSGENRLNRIGQQMESGTFGFDLEAGQFIDLGNGVTVRFDGVDRETSKLSGVFFRTPDTTFTASQGRLGFDYGGHVLVDLDDGRSVNDDNGNSLSFSRFHFDSGGRSPEDKPAIDDEARRKGTALPALLSSQDPGDRAVAYSRLMWPAFALLIPFLATVLGKPQRRTSSSLGLMLGLVLLVVFTRSTGLVATTPSIHPAAVVAQVGAAWLVTVGLVLRGERQFGAGYVDGWLLRLLGRLKWNRLRLRFGRHVIENRGETAPARS